MPSAMFLRTFLRTRAAALLGALAIVSNSQFLFLQGHGAFARALAGTCIGTSALTAHRQTATMTETTVATNVHQTLDVHGGFTTQIAFQSHAIELITDLFQIRIGQFLDFFRVINATRFANFAGCRATDAINSSQADLSMLVRRNINASYTSHICPLIPLINLGAAYGADPCKSHAPHRGGE